MRSFTTIRTTLLSLFVLTNLAVWGQTKEEKRYKEESDKIRAQVWAWDKPEFKKRDIPAEYANMSKVVIARHTELAADSRSKFVTVGISFGMSKEMTITEIARDMIRLNDKSAVDEYSELSFTKLQKISGFFAKDKIRTYIGVRVIKPNGSTKEINADEVVLTKDASNEKQAKLAISDLQPGDIIDYFIAVDQVLSNDLGEKSYNIFLFDDAPVLHYSFHGQLGKKFAIDYRSYNGAPQLKVSKNDDKDIVIDVEKKNMTPYETSLWISPAQQLPHIRMNISLGYRGPGSKYLGTSKPGEVNMNKESDEIVQDQSNAFSNSFYSSYFMKAARAQFESIVSDAKKMAKQAGLNYKEMSDDDKAAQLFYTLRFTKLLDFNIDELQRSINIGNYSYNGLAFVLNCTFKAADLDPAILTSTPRTGYRMKEVMDKDDLVSTSYLMGGANNKFFSIESVYDIPFAIPESLQGTKDSRSITFKNRAAVMSANAMNKFAEVGPGRPVPASDAKANAHIEEIALVLNQDKANFKVDRRTTIKGYYKADLQKQLILYEDYYESERKAMGEEQTLLEKLEDSKKGRKYVDEVRSAFAEARKKQKTAFTDEAKDWFDQSITDISDYKVSSLGVRHTSPDLVYSSSFNMDGLVKKAGNNYIVEIGKIQGSQLTIKQEQRKRDIDIYMPYPRSIEYSIAMAIPEGYTAEGVEALNKNVSNETGLYTVDASNDGKVVRIKIKKHYLHSFESVANWDKLLQFVDAANDWSNTKLLLKKK